MRILIAILCTAALHAADAPDANWTAYGHDGGGSKHSALKQIDRSNVSGLKVAWSFRTGEPLTSLHRYSRTPNFEPTPLVIDGVMYFGTPYGNVYALDAVTGKSLWSYDTKIDRDGNYGDFANRGVSTWVDPSKKPSEPCRRVIYMASIDARLFALDAAAGQPCPAFGKEGMIDLKLGLRRAPSFKGEYEETSPPAVIGNMVIVGSGIADNNNVRAASGEVRAFDAHTGALHWTWHPLDTETSGAANAWSMISVDPGRNLVFIPTGSASPDYWGGLRPGDDLYANSVVALNAATGKMVWHFQTVHHDLWDYDVASQPLLFTMKHNGVSTPAVAVGSKTGHLFLLTRDKGQPIFGVEERKVPASDVEGEHASPTQPVPLLPKPWIPQSMRPDDAWGPTESDRKACSEQIAALRNEGIFTPPSIKGSLIVPGNIGGMHWGGMSFDPESGLLLVPSNNFPAIVRLIPQNRFQLERMMSKGWETTEQKGAPYAMSRGWLMGPSGLPCAAPPWGTLAAIDTATGKLAWQSPLGEVSPATAGLGSINLGGPITTAGGLTFIGASFDAALKAFDTSTGKLLWRGELPASARSTPMTYSVNGKQYIAIAAGGHESDFGKLDNTIMVFSLP
jgi:quinoprotein glucose dehydrogenase